MSQAPSHNPQLTRRKPDWLGLSGGAWFVATVYGQLLFLIYILGVYGRASLAGDITAARNPMPHGFIEGDGAGNAMLALHLALAAILTLLGAVQLIPAVRRRWPRCHRWSGRVYLPSALIAGIGGIYLTLLRPDGSGLQLTDLAITLNGLIIVVTGVIAWRRAIEHRFADHQVWAMRLFLAVSGVWFLRVGIMAWAAIHLGDPPGLASMQDWFFVSWSFGCYLVPLVLYELWRVARATGAGTGVRTVATVLIGLSAVLILVGSSLAMGGMWLPYLQPE